ncbi:MAG: carboxylesterase family protein [Alphaproteobacteria bacterium]|nr:carboxylesterase family protein [Alphaproteobacteria bacterium]
MAALVGGAATIGSFVEALAAGPKVTIDSGNIEGKALPSGARAYLGIPYAPPPVRENRWRDPQSVTPWQGVYHADRFAPDCIQGLRGTTQNHYFGQNATSEDCLYLNVWAGKAAHIGAKLPVMVWIYGGGFATGSASMAMYSGESLAKKGVVYVSFNYRTGPFGFMAHPELTAESPHHASGDYGFLDQVAALKWVKRNIARFGGDPNNVTIVGQSAGSMSVSALDASPLARGLFHRAVGMSGSVFDAPGGIGGMPLLDQGEKDGLALQAALKVDSLNAMRQVPADRIFNVQGIRYWPIVDGYFMPQKPRDIFAAGKQNDAALLIGFTRDESFSPLASAATPEAYETAVRHMYGDKSTEFLKDYPALSADWHRNAMNAGRDTSVALMMWNWARMQSRTGKAPVYAYMFARMHPYAPGVVFSDHDPIKAGVYHASDIAYWLDTLGSLNLFRKTRDWTSYDRQLADEMSNMIVNFARTGNPSISDVAVPKYDTADPRLVELGETIHPIAWPEREYMPFLDTLSPAPRTVPAATATSAAAQSPAPLPRD